MHDQARAVQALPSPLVVVRVTEAHAHHAARVVGLVDIAAVDAIQMKDDHIAALGRHGHGVFQLVFLGIEVWRTGRAIGILQHMGDFAALVRTRQEADLAIFMAGIVQVERGNRHNAHRHAHRRGNPGAWGRDARSAAV